MRTRTPEQRAANAVYMREYSSRPENRERMQRNRQAWADRGGRNQQSVRRRHKVIMALGGRCMRCGFDDPRALQVDHVSGGGSKEHALIGTGGVASRVLRGDPGYQLLCANCNWIKRVENREYQ
jgi:hypothetical protein